MGKVWRAERKSWKDRLNVLAAVHADEVVPPLQPDQAFLASNEDRTNTHRYDERGGVGH